MGVRAPALAVVASLIALLAPAIAAADDASVYAAWTSRADESKQLSARWDTAFKRWKRSNLRDWKTMYEANQAVARLAHEIDRAVAAEPSSTAGGQRAKAAVQASLRNYRRSYLLLARATREAGARKYDTAMRLIQRAARYDRSATRYVRKARAEFKAIGIVPASRMAICRACATPP
jgi:hypothetical protein